jgi:protein TonB
MSRGLRLSLAGATLAAIAGIVAVLPWQLLWTGGTAEKTESPAVFTGPVDFPVETSTVTKLAQQTSTPQTDPKNLPVPENTQNPVPGAAPPTSTAPPQVETPSQPPLPKKKKEPSPYYASAAEQAGRDIMQSASAKPIEPARIALQPPQGQEQPPTPGGITEPIVVFRVTPEYTAEARVARVTGTVELVATVREDGSAKFERITKSLGFGLDEASAAAVEQWKFIPAKKDGKPVAVLTTLQFHFGLK